MRGDTLHTTADVFMKYADRDEYADRDQTTENMLIEMNRILLISSNTIKLYTRGQTFGYS